ELTAQDESLRQTIGTWLHAVGKIHAPPATIAEQLLKPRCILRSTDDQHVAHASQHQRGQRIVDHRLVIDRQQLLADRERGRVQTCTGTAGEDDSLAIHWFSSSVVARSTPACHGGSASPNAAR